MIFSTFVPTFVHFSIASWSLISVVPRSTTPADDWLSHAFGCVGIGLLATLAAGLLPAAVWGLGSALLSHFQMIGNGYLSIFRWVAAALGEPV